MREVIKTNIGLSLIMILSFVIENPNKPTNRKYNQIILLDENAVL
jgi:hypothetical protein